MEGGTDKLGMINLYYVQRNIHNSYLEWAFDWCDFYNIRRHTRIVTYTVFVKAIELHLGLYF